MQLALLLQRRLGRTPDLHPPSNGQSGRGSEYVPHGSVDRYGVNGKIEVVDHPSLRSSLVDVQKVEFQIGLLIELIAASMRSISVVPSGAMRTSAPSRPVDNRRDSP